MRSPRSAAVTLENYSSKRATEKMSHQLFYNCLKKYLFSSDIILFTIPENKARVTVKLDFRRPPAPIFTPRMCFFHYSLFQKSRSVNSFSSSSSMIQRKNLNVIRFLICFGIERIGLKSIGLIHRVSIIRNLFRTVSTKLGFIKSRDI